MHLLLKFDFHLHLLRKKKIRETKIHVIFNNKKKKTIILIILINIDREDFSSSSKGPFYIYIYITTLLASLFHSFLSSPLLASIFLLQWKIHRDKTFYSTGCGSTRGKKSSKTCGGSNKSAGNPDRSAAAKKACVFMQRRGNIEFFPSQ